MKEQRSQSPIFVKTYDFLLWLIPLTLKFPKSQRFLLAERLSKMGLDFYDLILESVLSPEEIHQNLSKADILLNKIRLYMRLSFDLKCISLGQYEYASMKIEEIGRLLGGWKKNLNGQQSRIKT